MKAKTIEPFMIELVKQIHGQGKSLTYAEQAKFLNQEFATEYTEKDVFVYYEPTVEEDEESLRLIYGSSVN